MSTLSLFSTAAAAQTAPRDSAPPKVQEQDEEAFIESVERGDAAAVRLFLKGGMSANVGEDQLSGEALLLRAIRGGHEEVVGLLLDAGADVGARGSPDLVSALSLAVEVGRPRIVRALLERKADVNYGDEDGHTNLMRAMMVLAISSLPPDALRFLENVEDDETRAIMKVARKDRLEILRLLLDAGAKLDETAYDCGLSALMNASMFGDAEVLRLLLERGADPNAGTKDWNALRFALTTREEMLKEVAGDVRRNALAFFEATEKGRAECARLLRAAGAREPAEWPEEEKEQGRAYSRR